MERRTSQLSLVYGGRSRPYDIRGVQCRLVTAASCPAGLDGYVLEEDTHRILTVDSVMTWAEEHPVRLMTELRTSGTCPVGSLVVRGKRWYAVVIDLDQEPLCQPQWITVAYTNSARRIRDNKVRRLATHLLGHIHGNHPLETCCHYLMVSLAQQEWQLLRELWIVVPNLSHHTVQAVMQRYVDSLQTENL